MVTVSSKDILLHQVNYDEANNVETHHIGYHCNSYAKKL